MRGLRQVGLVAVLGLVAVTACAKSAKFICFNSAKHLAV